MFKMFTNEKKLVIVTVFLNLFSGNNLVTKTPFQFFFKWVHSIPVLNYIGGKSESKWLVEWIVSGWNSLSSKSKAISESCAIETHNKMFIFVKKKMQHTQEDHTLWKAIQKFEKGTTLVQ